MAMIFQLTQNISTIFFAPTYTAYCILPLVSEKFRGRCYLMYITGLLMISVITIDKYFSTNMISLCIVGYVKYATTQIVISDFLLNMFLNHDRPILPL